MTCQAPYLKAHPSSDFKCPFKGLVNSLALWHQLKRLIGLPGDRVELRSGDLYVNGELYPEEYVKNDLDFNTVFEVPEGKFLFLGDNRATSNDARFWDEPYIDMDEVIGKGGLRVYPLSDIGFLK